MTEQKIREAFAAHRKLEDIRQDKFDYQTFRAGYLALLNELEPMYFLESTIITYALPEGVTK
jgi:hypothetical protein